MPVMKKKTRKKSSKPRASVKSIVVIGASAGGNKALHQLLGQLKPEMDAAFLGVIHITQPQAHQIFLNRLQKNTTLVCKVAVNGEDLKKGHFYLAPADSHLLVKHKKILLGFGPAENRWRPSIDVLFRSAAAEYDSKAIGVILTGMLDDGTSGMWAIHQSGGTCIVQDPADAEYSDMPVSVMNKLKPDHLVPLEEMGETISAAIKKVASKKTKKIPVEVASEAKIAERSVIAFDEMDAIGNRSAFSCPDCGGALWEMKNEAISRYRCHIGHTYSQVNLADRLAEKLEDTLWMALRLLEEKQNLSLKMADQYRSKGFKTTAEIVEDRATMFDKHIERLRALLFTERHAGND
jgi:two-component system, chemotaxis family, protein-glutamate methylesterase/glutaminase